MRRTSVVALATASLALFPALALAQTATPDSTQDGGAPAAPADASAAASAPAPASAAASAPASAPASASAAAPASASAPAAAQPSVQIASLRLMREKGIITQAEYESALFELGASVGQEASEAPSLVVGKWSATLYGFAEADAILDTTESFSDVAGNGLVQRPSSAPTAPGSSATTYPGDHGRMQFSIRNSRLGVRFRAPELAKARASGTLEMDFLGYEPNPAYPAGSATTEANYFNNPTMRVRHAYFKVETPIVDVLVGQTWHLFGWQPVFHPNTVQIQGVPGELYARTMQVKLSKKLALGPTSLEIAAAALRPPQRDSMVPEFTGGLRFSVDKLSGLTTQGATGKTFAPASIAATGTMRNFNLPEFSQVPSKTVSLTSYALAVDAFVPVIPASKGHEGNSLSISGEFVTGGGIADLFTGLTGGIGFPSIPNKTGINPPPTYPQNVDNGLLVYDNCPSGNPNDPAGCNDLHAIQYNVVMVGAQYYLPGLGGKVWVAANYARVESPNIDNFVRTDSTAPNPAESNYSPAAGVRKFEEWVDGCLFVDPLPSVRLGLEYAYYYDRYVDGAHAINHRGQLSGFFLF